MTTLNFLSVAAAPTRLDPLQLFLDADIVVQLVILGLLLASLWVWTIIIGFGMRLANLRRKSAAFEAEFWEQENVEAMLDGRSRKETPSARVAAAGIGELRRSHKAGLKDPAAARERVALAMEGQVALEADLLGERLGFLATTGAVAPFVGLFGTVWGIMNSFFQIGEQANSSLAVVAPGISEALFATAIGLFAAIPALMAYNKLQSEVAKASSRLEAFADEFSAILSRQIDERLAA